MQGQVPGAGERPLTPPAGLRPGPPAEPAPLDSPGPAARAADAGTRPPGTLLAALSAAVAALTSTVVAGTHPPEGTGTDPAGLSAGTGVARVGGACLLWVHDGTVEVLWTEASS